MSYDSDEVEILMSNTSVQGGVNLEDVNLEDVVNMKDGVQVEDGANVDGRANVISSSSSGPSEPFIVDYVCTREGFRRVSWKEQDRTIPEPAETKIGCKAIMGIKKDGEKWIVNKFVVGHNHILLIPRSTSFLRGHMGVTKVQKKLIMTLNESGVPIRKIMSVMSKESGGDFNVGCIGKDVENYVGNKRRKVFEEGDAQRLYSYFVDRQLKEPGFVFSIQVDKNGCMESCFWADVRSRAAY
ncbi:protein FAR1-RELATED SEQUENCE 5-like [Carya illinoinensis]|uniref:protein FAR1-RELATED SEQUENCE 5-like n=1 Tax=Carya illinoinensis TaxID=32201 RepID=UPI001C71CDC2|nr:protein FAR1-RELATED SEQUENCE 5-like [Carya illinoinensis]